MVKRSYYGNAESVLRLFRVFSGFCGFLCFLFLWVFVGIPTDILWEWVLKFYSHGNPDKFRTRNSRRTVSELRRRTDSELEIIVGQIPNSLVVGQIPVISLYRIRRLVIIHYIH